MAEGDDLKRRLAALEGFLPPPSHVRCLRCKLIRRAEIKRCPRCNPTTAN